MSKVILITGASTGLGETMATYLSGKGYTVYGTSRHIQPDGKPFTTLPMDVRNAESIQQAVGTIVEQQGRIDVLINNAGLGIAGPMEALSLADIEKVIDTNLLGALRVCQAVLPHMRRQQSGLIINISSIGSETGLPYRGAYSASKAALDRITEAFRTELAAFGVQACYVQPGGIQTDINRNRLTVALPKDSPYAQSFENCYNVINQSVSKGMPPERFGPVIESIINSKKVKRCYRVGSFLEKLSVVLKRRLPAATFEKMLRDHYKM